MRLKPVAFSPLRQQRAVGFCRAFVLGGRKRITKDSQAAVALPKAGKRVLQTGYARLFRETDFAHLGGGRGGCGSHPAQTANQGNYHSNKH